MHVESRRGIWGDPDSRVFRVYGFKPHKRLCLFDFTRWLGRTRVRLGTWTVYDG